MTSLRLLFNLADKSELCFSHSVYPGPPRVNFSTSWRKSTNDRIEQGPKREAKARGRKKEKEKEKKLQNKIMDSRFSYSSLYSTVNMLNLFRCLFCLHNFVFSFINWNSNGPNYKRNTMALRVFHILHWKQIHTQQTLSVKTPYSTPKGMSLRFKNT